MNQQKETTPKTPSGKHTVQLDDLTGNKLDYLVMFFREAGVTSPKQREIISRAIDFYTEYVDELVIEHNLNPKSKLLKGELQDLMLLKANRPSPWGTHSLPKVNLESYGCFPKFTDLVRSCLNPLKLLPKLKKHKA
jgi:hypothetical protein